MARKTKTRPLCHREKLNVLNGLLTRPLSYARFRKVGYAARFELRCSNLIGFSGDFVVITDAGRKFVAAHRR